MSERELTYGEAVREAIAEEMRRDPRVFLIGEDVAEAGHPFKTLVGLVQEFGPERIIDTPISEPGYAGIRDDSPVVIFEDKMMYRGKGPVPAEDYTIPFGMADIKREGNDITIVATSSMVPVALGAAKMLEDVGISAEVIDPRTTWPLDKQALIDSAQKTSRAMVVDEGYERYGVTAEIASVIAEGAFYHLDAPVKRIGAMDVPVPFSPVLEDQTVPTPESVAAVATTLCNKT